MPRLEEIVYDAGRQALADQESLVAGIRDRTGTLLAANTLVASFLGGATLGKQRFEWYSEGLALVLLVASLVVAASILWPRRMVFALDARNLYAELYESAAAEAEDDTLGWLAQAGMSYQDFRARNEKRVTRLSRLSALLGVLVIGQTIAWLVALAVH